MIAFVSSSVVKRAKRGKLAIIIENIKGFRKLYRKGEWSMEFIQSPDE
jgi:hypothetical protein